jgi:PIN domain nuclease of toxin-antitoxin system
MGDAERLKFLLDTHIWIWLAENPKRIGQSTYRTLQNQLHEIWISPISVMEALNLHHKGKALFHGDPKDWVAHATLGTKEAPFTQEVALSTRQFPFDFDPADRILAATALVFDLTLVTADQRLLELKNIKTLANR